MPPSPEKPIVEPAVKPRRLISLQYNYSDSEDDETREERKARIVSTVCNSAHLSLFYWLKYSVVMFYCKKSIHMIGIGMDKISI